MVKAWSMKFLWLCKINGQLDCLCGLRRLGDRHSVVAVCPMHFSCSLCIVYYLIGFQIFFWDSGVFKCVFNQPFLSISLLQGALAFCSWDQSTRCKECSLPSNYQARRLPIKPDREAVSCDWFVKYYLIFILKMVPKFAYFRGT